MNLDEQLRNRLALKALARSRQLARRFLGADEAGESNFAANSGVIVLGGAIHGGESIISSDAFGTKWFE
jgi:hypothetical protein